MMNEEKMDTMLSQLIKMVGNMHSDQQEMKQEMHQMKQDQLGLQVQLEKMETKSEERHQEILARFKVLEIDQDFVWEKTVRNERDLANIKRQLSQ
ncbi:hypothetical protein J2Z40_002823 [Cytobacillus eiseniae]|uniref:Uncharacterized protein n=1 Tax=Cytobacillus eiseniae TaxID=762947 RepID=A0ABS4RIY1_9BACI|nr:hypothetical protein [Cytobacillus eiseniae]MBP2242249.1 hypothetical protein [Cytobacillus eiseniae]